MSVRSVIVRLCLHLARSLSVARHVLTRARLPLRVHLAIFAGLLLIPAFLLSAILLREAANERRREAELRLLQLANDLSDDISNELERSITVLRTLSYSASLNAAALEKFHAQASSLTGNIGNPDNVVLLMAPDGRQLVNTAVPWGTLLLPYSDPDALARAVETKSPVVTDLFWGRLRKQYVLNVLFPVVEGGNVTFVLALSLTPQRVLSLLQGQDLGGEWTTAVLDSKGVVVARSRAHEQYVGQKISDAARAQVNGVVHPADSIDGRRILRVMIQTRSSKWVVAAAVSEDYVNLLALRAIKNLVAGSVVILGIAGLLVALYGRELAGSVASITRAMEEGPKDTLVREASEAAERLHEASKALRDSEERFRSIFQNAATGIALAGLDERYIACNPAFSRIAGYPQAEVIGRTYMDIMHPADRSENAALTQRLLREEIPYFEIENRYLTRDGRSIWVQKHLSLTRDGRGRPTGILTLVTDMTERRENERELAIAVERSRIAQQTAHAALYEHTPDGALIYGEAVVALTGYSPQETSALQHGHRALIHPDDIAAALAANASGLESGEGYDINYRLRHRDGHYVWVHDRASVLKDNTVRQSRLIGMLIDISEQKAREEHINLLLREVNHRSKNMLGLVQAIARQTVATTSADFLARFSERIQALSANQDLLVRNEWGGIDLEELIEAQLAHMATLPNPRIDLNGPPLHMSPAAAQVIGMVMHELATNASKYGPFSGDQGRIGISWSVSADGTFTIIWREQGGPAVVAPQRTGFGSTVVGTMARMGLEAEVSHDFSPEGVVWTLTCPLAKVLDRSTLPSERRPKIAADKVFPKPGSPRVLVVEDDVPFAQILFDLAHELDFQCLVAHTAADGFALARKHRPSAIVLDVNLPDHSGLFVLDRLKRDPLTRHIPVHMASVTDYTQDALSMGAIGYMLKPVRRDDLVQAFRKLEQRIATPNRRLLIVEDDRVQRDSVTQLLGSPDIEIVAVGTVKDAEGALRQSSFDCIVTDLTLPDASGFDLLEHMAADQAFTFPPVIVYTGRSLSMDEEHRLRRYSSSIIVKGARSPERLLDEVTLFLHQVEAELPAERQRMLRQARDREALFEGRRILIVEDDVRNIFALSSVLEPRGAEVLIARNGKEALSVLERNPKVDIVLMDIMMPEMDGLTATREIRRHTRFAKLPVIALTAKAMKDDLEKCLEAGANDYVSKPLDVEMLLSLLRVWMPK